MSNEFALKLQSWIDGELSADEARLVETQVQADPAAAALAAELRTTRSSVRGQELERAVPDTREFYWSQVERRIVAEERAAERVPVSGLPWLLASLRRYWPQFAGAAAALVFLLVVGLQLRVPPGSAPDEIENMLDDAGMMAFRSDEHQLTLVWINTAPTVPVDEDPTEDVDELN